MVSATVLLLTVLAQVPLALSIEWSTLNGTGNNEAFPAWGSVGFQYFRLAPKSKLSVDREPSPRLVSSKIFAKAPALLSKTISAIGLVAANSFSFDLCSVTRSNQEPLPIKVPLCDADFDKGCAGDREMPFLRSGFKLVGGSREQTNEVSHWMDGSHIYGASAEAAASLREFKGGRLLMPTNSTQGSSRPLPARVPGLGVFQFGAVLNNIHPGVMAYATLFMREHNRFVAELAAADPALTDEALYQRGRARVGALMARVIIYEYLPLLIGKGLPPYRGYNASVRAGSYNEFCTAAWRYGHSGQFAVIPRAYPDAPAIEGHLVLRENFLNPAPLLSWNIDSLLYGAATNAENEVDSRIINDMTREFPALPFPFGAPASAAHMTALIDIAATNIQRGRDHELGTFNDVRAALGLPRFTAFSQFRTECAADLATLYASVDLVDLFVGGLCETPVDNGVLGPVFAEIVVRQFVALRDGDRFWFEREGAPANKLVEPFSAAGYSLPNGTDPAAYGSPYRNRGRYHVAQYESGTDPYGTATAGDGYGAAGNATVSRAPRDSLAWIVLQNTDLKSFPDSPFQVGTQGGVGAVAASGAQEVELTPWYKVAWKVDDSAQTVSITVTAKNDGYVGFGFSESKMVNADIVMGWKSPATGENLVKDMRGLTFGLPTLDADLGSGAKDDLSDTSFSVSSDGVATLKFTRKWDTGDAVGDNIVDPSKPVGIIFSVGPHARTKHPPNRRGTATIDLRSGASTVKTFASSQYVHAGGMAFGWFICAPLAVYFVRYKKAEKRWWLSAHKVLIGFGAGSIVPLFITGLVNSSISTGLYHSIAAFVFLPLVIIQIIMGNTMAWFISAPSYAKAAKFAVLRKMHRYNGRFVLIAGWVQVGTGLRALELSRFVWIPFAAWVVFITFLYAHEEYKKSLPVRNSYAKLSSSPSTPSLTEAARGRGGEGSALSPGKGGVKGSGSKVVPADLGTGKDGGALPEDGAEDDPLLRSQGENLPLMSFQAVTDAVKVGNKWAVIDGYVVNLAEVLNGSHPGGAHIVAEQVGKDCTKVFYGQSKDHRHQHSRPAQRKAHAMRIGILSDLSTGAAPAAGAGAATARTFVKRVVTRRAFLNHLECTITELRVLEANPEGHDLLLMVLVPSKNLRLALPEILPGQHVAMTFLTNNQDDYVTREMTPIDYDRETGKTTLLVRLLPGGQLSEILRKRQVGSSISLGLYSVLGKPIEVAEGIGSLVFVAGGSGIAPFYAFLSRLSRSEVNLKYDPPIYLIVYGRKPVLDAELRELAEVINASVAPAVHVRILQRSARPTAGTLGAALVDWRVNIASATAYVAGPPAFEVSVMAMLMELGVPQASVKDLNQVSRMEQALVLARGRPLSQGSAAEEVPIAITMPKLDRDRAVPERDQKTVDDELTNLVNSLTFSPPQKTEQGKAGGAGGDSGTVIPGSAAIAPAKGSIPPPPPKRETKMMKPPPPLPVSLP